MHDSVTVVIPHYNAETLDECLASVFEHSDVGLQVLVVDDGDNGLVLQRCLQRFPAVQVLRNKRNVGFSESCNRGLQMAQTPYAILLNDDTRVTSGWLDPLIEAAESEPAVAACQPKLLSPAEEGLFDYSGGAGGYIDAFGFTFCRGRLFASVEHDEGQYDRAVPLFWACGSAIFLRLEAVRQVGLLDLDYFMHFEEIDLCWRLRLAGWRVAAVPASTVFHYGARSLPSDSFYKVYLNHRNNLVVLIKNLPASRLLWLLPVRLLLELVASLQYLLRGRLASTLAPPLGMLWLLSHPLALWRRRRSSRRLVIEEGDQRTDGVYSGSALLSYFLGGRRRSDELIVEAAE